MQQILGVIGVIAAILSYALFKSWQLKRERKRMPYYKLKNSNKRLKLSKKSRGKICVYIKEKQ